MILIIDNYDSFSYNLYQIIGELHPDIKVIKNDELTVLEIETLAPSHIILSPGPGKPDDSGVCKSVIRELSPTIPILGVCLGHQAIFETFGGTVSYAKHLMHGKSSTIEVSGGKIFKDLPNSLTVARYHSLIAKSATLPDCLQITASSKEGEIMAIEHKEYPLHGVQFHPESILTPDGKTMIQNFLKEGK